MALCFLCPELEGATVLSDEPVEAVANYNTVSRASLIIGNSGTFQDVQWAVGFRSGNTPTILDSALFLYNGVWPGTTGGFEFSLHSDINGLPGAVVERLDGPMRPTEGFTWYQSGGVCLEAATVYWLVATNIQIESPRFFEWRATSDPQQTMGEEGWSLLDYSGLRTDGGIWRIEDDIPHTAVRVIPIPEPGIFWMSSLALFAFINKRRRCCPDLEAGNRAKRDGQESGRLSEGDRRMAGSKLRDT